MYKKRAKIFKYRDQKKTFRYFQKFFFFLKKDEKLKLNRLEK